jgi:hypothetical protein
VGIMIEQRGREEGRGQRKECVPDVGPSKKSMDGLVTASQAIDTHLLTHAPMCMRLTCGAG